MELVTRAASFIGKITESTVAASTGGFPQWNIRLETLKCYVTAPDDLKHFNLTEPGWVEWTGEQIVAWLTLYGKNGDTLNYEQAQIATGWDGTDYVDLLDLIGKEIQFRTQFRTFDNVEKLEVNWIDSVYASPERTLKSADPATIKALTAQFITKKAAFKPAGSKPSPAVAGKAPGTKPSVATPQQGAPAKVAAPVAPAPVVTAAKPGRPPAAKPQAAPVVPATAPAVAAVPTEFADGGAAWEYIQNRKGNNDDAVVADAWQSCIGELQEKLAKDEAEFTPADYGQVVKTLLADLAV